ncbi:MAG: cation:proton antiporter [Candidatus Omnitrophica bacterium]|nr:cation:proton antiporter [Candidatus Omnitrophota bacterium]
MIEPITYILNKISLAHLNVLFLLGLALFGGTVGGRLFQKIKIPQVVGYIIIGLIIGQTGLKIVGQDIILSLEPFNYFALGLIGFMIGGELKGEIFRKYGKQLIITLLCEGITPFLLVTLFISVIGFLFFGSWKISVALALLFGAIASATDPATTAEVLKEYKTRGPLTRTILGIVALDDGLALGLFVIASSIAGSLIGKTQTSLFKQFINPIYEIGGALAVGAISGIILSKILRKYSEKERLLAFSVGIVLIVTGLSMAIHVEMLLAAMTLGVIVSNFTPRKSKEAFMLVEAFTPPIYVLFFVLVGAKLNLNQMNYITVLLGIIYLFGTITGKFIGSRFGSTISKAPKSVRLYLPLGLFSQAGIAIGLSILAAQYFPGTLGNTLIIVITTTTFILQLVGPPFVKLAVTKAGEVGLNVTEEDLMDKLNVNEMMDKNPPLIYNNMPLAEIIKIFSQSTNLYYPVINLKKKFLGIITVDNIKNTFMESGLEQLLNAVDLMESDIPTVTPENSLRQAKELFDRYNLECLPVVTKEGGLEGFMERRIFNKAISTKMMQLKKQVDFLEDSK